MKTNATEKLPLVIGLTGGIGAGKSTAAAIFAQLGVPVIDADIIARECVSPGSASLKAIQSHFGANILDATGNLDRAQLRKRIFASPADKAWLENLLHPVIYQKTRESIKLYPEAPYIIAVIPLLFEIGRPDFIDQILLIDASEHNQKARASSRDNTSLADIEAIMAAQRPRSVRQQLADDIISNNGDMNDLRAEIIKLHEKYLELARQRDS